MSLFLGKIHYWLFDKILWFEKLEDEIIKLAKEEGFDVEKISCEIQSKYGQKIPDKPLEELIDTSNIHGWLQDKIHCAERRMAAWTKLLIESNEGNYIKLEKVYKSQGVVAADEVKSTGRQLITAEELFNCMNDYILDGMPCDRVNEIVINEEDKIEWIQRICVHKDIWQEVGFDVNYFYELRNIWIKSFINELNKDFEYLIREDGTKTILKVKK